MSKKEIERNDYCEYIDIAKGVGMLAVIWGHIMLTGLSNTFIYSFHMPLFFFLAGFVFCSEKYIHAPKGTFIKKRINTLIFPYLFFSIFTYGVWVLYTKLLLGGI